MKWNNKSLLLVIPALVLIMSGQIPISALTSAKSSASKLSGKQKDNVSAANESENSKSPEEEINTAGQEKLVQLSQAFQQRPDDNTYGALWENFVAFIQQQTSRRKDPSHLVKTWKALSEVGLKVIEPIGSDNAVHVYVFNRPSQNTFIPQAKSALIQWNEQSNCATATSSSEHKVSKKSHIRKPTMVVLMKTQAINIPNSVDIKEANLLPHITAIKVPIKTSTKRAGRATSKVSRTNKVNVAANHYLALSGTDQQSGHNWLSAMKQTAGGWSPYQDLFQDVPSFLVQSNSAKIKFAGNNLIISMGGTSGYELVLPFTEEHFAFNTKEAQDSAAAVAHQFLLALQYKKPDLAKVWLSDPKLVSIPGYLGLFGHATDNATLQIANMQTPICGGSRFRLITGTKDDLIIDIAKIKNQWLIKGLFIAPGSSLTVMSVKN